MARSRVARWVAAAGGRARGLHAVRISSQYRAHLAALLIVAVAPFARAADEISFDPAITQADFAKFSRIVAQAVYASPVQPARASGILGFEVGVAATAVKVDTKSSYWRNSVGNDFSKSGYVAVPRLVISNGFGSGNLSASYAKVSGSNVSTYGGSLDIPIINGGLLQPTVALRTTYATIKGIDVYDLKTYGAELFLSKGFTFVTPYGAIGESRSDARGTVTPQISLLDKATTKRYTLGLRFSFVIPKIVIEASQGEERSYSAKVSFGL
ncbi:MAG: hypothetical protein ACXV5L_04600 [Thermoanaerobaculia bacterium]